MPESQPPIEFYSAGNVQGIEHLIYFAMSVFWRAAIHQWRWGGDSFGISLGPYAEKIRRFLLDEDEGHFPSNIHLALTICRPSRGHAGALYFPRQFKRHRLEGTYHSSEFFIPGMHYMLYTGQRIPDFLKSVCIVTSPGRPITVSDELIEKAFNTLMQVARKGQRGN